MDPRLLFNGGNRAMGIDRFLCILEMEFLFKIDFKMQTCLFTVPPSSPRILNVDTNDAWLGC